MTGTASEVPVRVVEVLDDLERQLGNREACHRFVRDFISQWEARHAAVLYAHRSGVPDQVLSAVISLESSSLTLGLAQLSKLCKELRARIAEDDTEGVRRLLPLLRSSGAASTENLQRSYLNTEACSR